jgi:molybdopterin-guanine dinucleotide biosynthesis protein A
MPQREYLFGLLQRHCAAVHTSCRADQNVPAHLNPVLDAFNISGPLNGVLSAFKFNADTPWLAVAIDMPFVNDHAIEALLAGRDETKLATSFINPKIHQPEPLLTIWERAAYPLLLKFAEQGNISPRDFLKTHSIKLIEAADERILVNFNSPEDRRRFN